MNNYLQNTKHVLDVLQFYGTHLNGDLENVSNDSFEEYVQSGILEENSYSGQRYKLTLLGREWWDRVCDIPKPIQVVTFT